MPIILFVTLLLISIFLIKYAIKLRNKRLYELLEQFPSKPTYPLIGNFLMLRVPPKEILGVLENLMESHKRLLFWLGPIPVIFLKKYDDIMAVSTLSQNRDHTLHFSKEWLGTGLLNANYEEWKKSKRILAPAFNSVMLSRYVDVFQKKAATLVDILEPAADSGEIFNCQDILMKINIETIAENTAGVLKNSGGEEEKQFANAIVKAFQSIMKRARSFWIYPSFTYKMYLLISRKGNLIKQFWNFPEKILREELKKGSFEDDSSKTIVSLLVRGSHEEEQHFTEARMRDELLQKMVAASETTSINVGFTLLMLAMHQDIQQKVYEEISEIFKDNDTLTVDHLLHQLKYLEQCIKETSRKYTHVVVTTRRTHKECILKDNTIIPANIAVMSIIHIANQDPELYKNPHKWDPEHFSDEAVKNRPKNSFMSFGCGPRSCIGERYAIMSIKTQIVYVIHKYHLSTNIKELTRAHLTTHLGIGSKIGYPIQFIKRVS
ncbi:cytochrome P450 4C1-like [Planococcus citri]|uniref:cytochrome P450 4C1-like n=1 Tax=Planococcus citri TaxID=170843 RepID=UPI0031FA3C7D